MNYSLCQIYDNYQAWFSTDVENTVGEDWGKSSHQASTPHSWEWYGGHKEYHLLSICFTGLDLIKPPSHVSVFSINRGSNPWVRLWSTEEVLYAGTSLQDFCLYVKRHKGELYIPASHLEILRPIIAALELI